MSGVIALILVDSLGPSAASSREAISAQAPPPKVIRLVSTPVTFRALVDKPPKGATKGDTTYTASVLANAVAQFGIAKGAVVGGDAGRATNVGAVPMTVNILVVLPGGALRVRGRSRAVGQTQVEPVIGGTGRFKGSNRDSHSPADPPLTRIVERLPTALLVRQPRRSLARLAG